MSRLRNVWLFDATGNPIDLDVDSRLPVSSWLYDSAGTPIVLDSSRVPTKSDTHDGSGNSIGSSSSAGSSLDVGLHDAAGNAIGSSASAGSAIDVAIHDSAGTGLVLESNGGVPVNIQDQTTPTVIIPAHKVVATSTLAALSTIDTRTVSVTDASAMSVGEMYVITSTVGDRYTWGWITAIAGAGPYTVTLSNYLDYAFESGQEFSSCTANLGVNGSVTRQIFSLRAAEPAGGINLTVDVTRVIIQFLTSTAPVLTDFGDIAGGITNGLLCRKKDGTYQNIFDFRSNFELQSLAYDMQLYTAIGLTDNGLSARLSFNGQEKMGVVHRIATSEDLEFIVSDNLSALTDLRIMIQGHIVQGN